MSGIMAVRLTGVPLTLSLSFSLSSGPPVSLQTVKTQRTIKFSKSTWLSFLHVVPFNL